MWLFDRKEKAHKLNLTPQSNSTRPILHGNNDSISIAKNQDRSSLGLGTKKKENVARSQQKHFHPNLEHVRGVGTCDFIISGTFDIINALTANNVAFEDYIIPGCHTWFVWREELRDLLETVAFKIN